MLPSGPTRDLSQQAGNPTHAIQQSYHQLMAIQDPQELQQAALELVKPMVGRGISDQNFRKFVQRLNVAAQRGIQGMQKYLSDFMLAGSGMGVIGGGGRQMARESLDIATIANLITEDADIIADYTPAQLQLKQLVESYGYRVRLLNS